MVRFIVVAARWGVGRDLAVVGGSVVSHLARPHGSVNAALALRPSLRSGSRSLVHRTRDAIISVVHDKCAAQQASSRVQTVPNIYGRV